ALADAGLLAVDLGHHGLGVTAEHDRIAVAAVGGHDLVVRLDRSERAHDRGLGAVGRVGVAADHAGELLEGPLHAVLELPDPGHLGVHPDQPVVVELCHRVSSHATAALNCAAVASYERLNSSSMGSERSASDSTSTPQGLS